MRKSAWSLLLVLSTSTSFGCATKSLSEATARAGQTSDAQAAGPQTSSSVVALGRLLFHDKRLSRNGDVACSSCHTLSKYGVDGTPAGVGSAATSGEANGQRVFNTRAHIAEVWDARATSVDVPTIEAALGRTLGRVPRYLELFHRAFPNDARPISVGNVSETIEAFERGLVSSSRWDKFAAGDVSALTLEEKRGLRVFLESGCAACHAGPQVGGTMYREVGIAYPWPKQKDTRTVATDAIAKRLALQVPSLKNIAETAPYFHDSSVSNLEAAIRLMGHHQLGVELSTDDVNAIAAWMRTLSGEVDPVYIAVPELPAEG
jgi:cytochrome c peroxidase